MDKLIKQYLLKKQKDEEEYLLNVNNEKIKQETKIICIYAKNCPTCGNSLSDDGKNVVLDYILKKLTENIKMAIFIIKGQSVFQSNHKFFYYFLIFINVLILKYPKKIFYFTSILKITNYLLL